MFDLGIETTSPGQVDAALRALGATDSSVVKARRFFIQAAQRAGIEIGPHLRVNVSNSRTTRRSSKPKVTKSERMSPADSDTTGVAFPDAALTAWFKRLPPPGPWPGRKGWQAAFDAMLDVLYPAEGGAS